MSNPSVLRRTRRCTDRSESDVSVFARIQGTFSALEQTALITRLEYMANTYARTQNEVHTALEIQQVDIDTDMQDFFF